MHANSFKNMAPFRHENMAYWVDVEAVVAPSFLYYLNSTQPDRNLEWDMKNNLCPKPGKIGQPQP